MTLEANTENLLKAYGADATTLRRFVDAHLDPTSKYHSQVLRFITAVDSVFDAQNSLNDWANGHIHMRRADQDPHYEVESAKLTQKREEFVGALKELLEAFEREGVSHE